MGALMTELIKKLGPKVAKVVFDVVVNLIVTVGTEAAAQYLKRKYKIDIDKSAFQKALDAVKRP